jgi:ABC-type multidrug transport system ATPase subunit
LSLQPVPGAPSKVDTVINTLRLQNCADTLAGNGVIRGISGGEKRRLSIAEMLMGNPRVLCLDEIT